MNALVFYWADSLLSACWQGGLALGLIWGLCRLFPKMASRLRCWLWRVAYIKLMVALLGLPVLALPLLPASPAAHRACKNLPSAIQ